jgi:hypothetical protein
MLLWTVFSGKLFCFLMPSSTEKSVEILCYARKMEVEYILGFLLALNPLSLPHLLTPVCSFVGT